MGMDKKVQHRQLRFVLLNGLGDAIVTADYDEGRLTRVLEAAN
jgi:3-dehydroquinate synthetase